MNIIYFLRPASRRGGRRRRRVFDVYDPFAGLSCATLVPVSRRANRHAVKFGARGKLAVAPNYRQLKEGTVDRPVGRPKPNA